MLALGRMSFSEGGFEIDSRMADNIHLNPGLDNWLKPPKLSDLQQRELLKMHATGEYLISDLGKLCKISRPTVYLTVRLGQTQISS